MRQHDKVVMYVIMLFDVYRVQEHPWWWWSSQQRRMRTEPALLVAFSPTHFPPFDSLCLQSMKQFCCTLSLRLSPSPHFCSFFFPPFFSTWYDDWLKGKYVDSGGGGWCTIRLPPSNIIYLHCKWYALTQHPPRTPPSAGPCTHELTRSSNLKKKSKDQPGASEGEKN